MQSRLRGTLSNLGREALRIVLPSWCVACRAELPWQERTASCCTQCWAALPKITSVKCTFCALPAPSDSIASFVCIDCSADPLPLAWCDAWGEYEGTLERLVQALKFERHDFLDEALAALLAETVEPHGEQFDAIAGVPMHRAKLRRRGYNQAELLARRLSLRLGARCDMTLLSRQRERATQSTLPKRARAANVRGAFAASSRVKGKSILVVDDVCTTGETLRACASALRAAGAARVCAVTVARAS